MSDRNQDLRETQAIEQAWNQVQAIGTDRPRLVRGDADPARVREYTELLGLLPYQLTPEAPPAGVRETIMSRAADAEETVASDAAPIVLFEKTAAGAPAAPRSPWRFAQAAALAASLVGLGFLSATVWQQNQRIAQLNQQVQAAASNRDDVLRARNESAALRDRLDMITTVARYAYPMRTVSTAGSAQKKPEGIVYVCGMHQQWYLSLRGLEPPAEGGEYHLWFMTDNGKIDGGIVEVRPGAPAEMESRSMPKGTRGFLVTLETPEEPEGLEILLGESAINL